MPKSQAYPGRGSMRLKTGQEGRGGHWGLLCRSLAPKVGCGGSLGQCWAGKGKGRAFPPCSLSLGPASLPVSVLGGSGGRRQQLWWGSSNLSPQGEPLSKPLAWPGTPGEEESKVLATMTLMMPPAHH